MPKEMKVIRVSLNHRVSTVRPLRNNVTTIVDPLCRQESPSGFEKQRSPRLTEQWAKLQSRLNTPGMKQTRKCKTEGRDALRREGKRQDSTCQHSPWDYFTSKMDTFRLATLKLTSRVLPTLPSLLSTTNAIGNVITKLISPIHLNALRIPVAEIRAQIRGAFASPPNPAPDKAIPKANPRWASKCNGVNVMTGK